MANKKDQGRYARMLAFWSLLFLLAYGCIRADGLVQTLRSWLASLGGSAWVTPWVDPFPLLGKLDAAMAIAVLVLLGGALALHHALNRPKLAELLSETESELRKVTWPSLSDTWKGSLAVVFTVAFLLVFLTGADLAIHYVLRKVMGE